MKIIINTKEYYWYKEWINYSDILELIGEKGNLITIVYHSKFLGNKHTGILRPNEQIIAANEMIIDATRTDNA